VTPILALEGVRVRYGASDVLDVPALAVQQGEVLAVVGPNGSGKSTLLRVLGLLETPPEGTVRFHGRAVDARVALAERRCMATVFQQALLTRDSVAANVAVGLRFRGASAATIEPRVARWLDRFGIAHLAGRAARSLSGGEAQRVALARALVLEPEVLLLDEPFAALDAPARAELLPELGAVLRDEPVTTILVTHDRAEAQALADRVAVLLGGRVRQLDDVARVFWAPASEEVARFVGVETIVDGRGRRGDGDRRRAPSGGRGHACRGEPRPRRRPSRGRHAAHTDRPERPEQRAQLARRDRRIHHPVDPLRPRRRGLRVSARGGPDSAVHRRAGPAARSGRDGGLQGQRGPPHPVSRDRRRGAGQPI
jgi:tungstate transport system ATP-binding protein